LPAHAVCLDSDDVDVFALALFLDAPLWTQDKALFAQDIVLVVSTNDLAELFTQ